MAVSVIIGASILIVQGPFAVTAPYPFPGVRILGVRTPFAYLAVTALLVLCFVALQLFLRRTRTGVAISALAQDLELARATGLRVRLLQVVSFGISGAILGVTGFVAAPVISIAPDSGISYILSGFIAAVIGGMGNLYGALVGGPIVGVMAMSSAYLFGGEFQNLVLLTLLVAVLLLVTGAIKVFYAFSLRPVTGWGWVLVSGLLSIVLAVFIFTNFPYAAGTVLGIFLAVELISNGVLFLFIALGLRQL